MTAVLFDVDADITVESVNQVDVAVELVTPEVTVEVVSPVDLSVDVLGVGPQGPPGTTGAGVPLGGTTGQILAKNTNNSYDTLWQNPPSTDWAAITGKPATFPSDVHTHTPGIAPEINLAANAELSEITVIDDGSATSGWPDRLAFKFHPQGGDPNNTSWFNEYGEFRVTSAKPNTVPLRLFIKNLPTDPAHTNNMFEIQDDRVTRGVIVAIDTAGNIAARNVQNKVVTWPTGSEPSSAGVPDGTMWVEYAP